LSLPQKTKQAITRPEQGKFLESKDLPALSHFQLADILQRDSQGFRRGTRGDTLHKAIQSTDVVVRDIHICFGEVDLHSDQFSDARNALTRMMPNRQETRQHWSMRLMAGLIGASLAPLDRVTYEHQVRIGLQSTIIVDVQFEINPGEKIAIEAGAIEPDKVIAALETSINAVIVLPYAGLKQRRCLGWAFQLSKSHSSKPLNQPVLVAPSDIDRAISKLTVNPISVVTL